MTDHRLMTNHGLMTMNAHVRIPWSELPSSVRARAEEIIGGGRVVEAATQSGGFSPGAATRVRTADGTRAFVKACSSALNAGSAEGARGELRITAGIPVGAPVPRLLGGFEHDPWVVVVLEDIDGRLPGFPWTRADLDIVVATLRELAVVLTPAPVRDVERTADAHAEEFGSWRLIADDPPSGLDPWVTAGIARLQAASAHGLAAMREGDTLNHCDIRGDNLLVRPDGTVVVVDWEWGTAGPDWYDRVVLAVDVIADGQDPAPALEGIDRDVVVGVIAGIAGSYLHASRRPAPPSVPTLRSWQRQRADMWLSWLATRL
jgi:hypothetical protein